MSVFTTVTPEQLSAWLEHYSTGTLLNLQPIPVGVENTNYFVDTSEGRYVLTLFERLAAGDLPFYLDLMAHLARRAIPCPSPVAARNGAYLGTLNGKPAVLVTRLPGCAAEHVSARQCAEIGQMLALMHLASANYPGAMANPRGAAWRETTAAAVLPYLDHECSQLLFREMQYQRGQRTAALPLGVIHADLFRDNVLWHGASLGGIVDFYFACTGALLYDVAVTFNDWCMHPETGHNQELAAALLGAYCAVRPFSGSERAAWPVLLRAAALRFWLSRLHDRHTPRRGELIQVKDPRHFQHILEKHIAHASALPG